MKNIITKSLIALFVLSIAVISCKKEDPVLGYDDGAPDGEQITNSLVTINHNGLENLGADLNYEAWLQINNNWVSIGKFNVNSSGDVVKMVADTNDSNEFPFDKDLIGKANKAMITIEESNDTDPDPSDLSVLAGDFAGNNAELTINDSDAISSNFGNITGKFKLLTPTTFTTTDESSGIWFVDTINASTYKNGLSLPSLPGDWTYEGWININGNVVSTGRFTNTSASDNDNPYIGSDAPVLGFPGEDFITSAPAGLTFPTDLANQTAFITIEMDNDNSTAPFFVRILTENISPSAVGGSSAIFEMENIAQTYIKASFAK